MTSVATNEVIKTPIDNFNSSLAKSIWNIIFIFFKIHYANLEASDYSSYDFHQKKWEKAINRDVTNKAVSYLKKAINELNLNTTSINDIGNIINELKIFLKNYKEQRKPKLYYKLDYVKSFLESFLKNKEINTILPEESVNKIKLKVPQILDGKLDITELTQLLNNGKTGSFTSFFTRKNGAKENESSAFATIPVEKNNRKTGWFTSTLTKKNGAKENESSDFASIPIVKNNGKNGLLTSTLTRKNGAKENESSDFASIPVEKNNGKNGLFTSTLTSFETVNWDEDFKKNIDLSKNVATLVLNFTSYMDKIKNNNVKTYCEIIFNTIKNYHRISDLLTLEDIKRALGIFYLPLNAISKDDKSFLEDQKFKVIFMEKITTNQKDEFKNFINEFLFNGKYKNY